MSHFLSSLPLWLLIVLIVVIPTALAMSAQVLIRRWVGIETLVKNNEIAGFKFATVGVIYAVLLAFSVIVVWEKFNDAQTSVAEEAGATAALFRYADGKEPEAVALRTALVNYLKTAIDEEWPAMALESEAHGVTQALDQLYSAALALNQSGTRDTADMSEVFRQIDNVTAARRVRLHLATGLVPDVIWIALFAGALLTVGFTLFFGSENLLAQVSMTGVLSLLVTLGLVVIISLDHPFTGRSTSTPMRSPRCSRNSANRQARALRRAVQNARRPPTTASVPARIGRRTRSGTREAKWLEIMMPGIEPTSSETSIWKSTDPSHQCPAPAISVSGTACAMSEPTMRTIGELRIERQQNRGADGAGPNGRDRHQDAENRAEHDGENADGLLARAVHETRQTGEQRLAKNQA